MKFYEAVYKLGIKASEHKDGEAEQLFTITHENKEFSYIVEYNTQKGFIKLDTNKVIEIPLNDDGFSLTTLTSGKTN